MRTRFFPLILLALVLPALADSGTGVAQPKLPVTVLGIGKAKVTAEIADTDATRSMGMMFRETMGENEGMLFVFERPTRASFWMRNTKIPLSIAYIDPSGVILEIHDMQPLDERTTNSTFDTVAYALEVPQGWFTKNGVMAGTAVTGLPAR